MIAFEQLYFDLLNPSYYFIKQAGRNRSGITHTEESKAFPPIGARLCLQLGG